MEQEQIYIPSTTVTFLGSNLFPFFMLLRFIRLVLKLKQKPWEICAVSLGEGPAPPWNMLQEVVGLGGD